MELIVGTQPTWLSSDLFPILIDDELAIHDSHALIEYIKKCSSGSLYRKKPNESAIARSLCAVNAFYAVLAFRLHLYGVELIGIAGKYQKSLLLWSLLQKAILQAKQWGKKQCITLV
jgi:glutathione S-transferase